MQFSSQQPTYDELQQQPLEQQQQQPLQQVPLESQQVDSGAPLNAFTPYPSDDFEGVKIFVGNLSVTTTKHTLGFYFSQFGPVYEAHVVKDQNTGESRRFGFVTVEDQDMADRLLREETHHLDGRDCNVSPASKSEKRRGDRRGLNGSGGAGGSGSGSGNGGGRSHYSSHTNSYFAPQPTYGHPGGYSGYGQSAFPTGNKIFVAKIPDHIHEEDLRKCFSIFGKIIPQESYGVKIVMDLETGQSKGFGFVTFRQTISAMKAAQVGEVYLPDCETPSPVKVATSTRGK